MLRAVQEKAAVTKKFGKNAKDMSGSVISDALDKMETITKKKKK